MIGKAVSMIIFERWQPVKTLATLDCDFVEEKRAGTRCRIF
jgi:hypothetical protein